MIVEDVNFVHLMRTGFLVDLSEMGRRDGRMPTPHSAGGREKSGRKRAEVVELVEKMYYV
jgi:hypothetical protein